jgi:hypothetical protein
MAETANPFRSIDLREDNHRYILGGGLDVKFSNNHASSVPSVADECVVGNSMYSLARFKRGDDSWPWSQLTEFLRGMECAWDVGRRDMQSDFRDLMGIKQGG